MIWKKAIRNLIFIYLFSVLLKKELEITKSNTNLKNVNRVSVLKANGNKDEWWGLL